MHLNSLTSRCLATLVGSTIVLGTVAISTPATANASSAASGTAVGARVGAAPTITSGTVYQYGKPFTFTGTGEPGAQFRISIAGAQTDRMPIAADGTWKHTVDAVNLAGRSAQVIVTTGGGTVTQQVTAAADARPFAHTSAPTYTRGEAITIAGTGTPGDAVFSDIAADHQLERVGTDGRWTITTAPVRERKVEVTLRHRGHVVTKTFTDGTPGDGVAKPITVSTVPIYERGEAFRIAGTSDVPNSTLRAKDGTNTAFTTPTDAQGNWSHTIPAGADATERHTFTLRFTIGGHELEQTFTASFGISSEPTYTKLNPLTIRGVGAPDRTVVITAPDGSTVARVAADNNGDWRTTVGPEHTARGSLALTFTQPDFSGKNRTFTTTFTAKPVTSTFAVTSDTTYLAGSALVVRGTGDPGEDVRVSRDGKRIATVVTRGDGTWVLPLGPEYTSGGRLALTFQQTPLGGAERTLDVTFTSRLPLDVTSDLTYTKRNDLAVTGRGFANATVRALASDGTVIARVTSDQFGVWKLVVDAGYTRDDSLALTFLSADSAGSELRIERTFTAKPVSSTFAITSEKTYLRDEPLDVSGTGDPGEDVRVFHDGKRITTTTADGTGKWRALIAPDYTRDDSVRLTFRQTPLGGTQRTIDATFTDATPIRITSSSSYDRGEDFRIAGTSPQRNGELVARDGDTLVFVAQIDAKGIWSATIPGTATDRDRLSLRFVSGEHELVQQFTARDGIVTPPIAVTSKTVYERGDAVRITGTSTVRNGTMAAWSGKDLAFVATTDAKGAWSHTIPAGSPITNEHSFTLRFAIGDHELTKKFTASFGLTSETTYTKQNELRITGVGAPNQNVWATTADGARVAIRTADAQGRWTLVVGAEHTAGNTLALTFHQAPAGGTERTFTSDFTAKAVASTFAVTSEKTYLKDSLLPVNGTGDPGEVVWATLDGKRIATSTADGRGRWSLNITREHTQQDSLDLVFHQVPLGGKEQTVQAAFVGHNAFDLTSATTYTKGHDLVASGVGARHQNVWATTADGDRVAVKTANSDGTWTLTIDAEHTGADTLRLTFHQVPLSGSEQTFTETFTAKPEFVSTSLDSTTFRAGQVATISGKATPGATVMVWAAEDWWLMPTVTLTADANGTWTTRTRSALPDAPVQIITRQTQGTKIENTRHTLTPKKAAEFVSTSLDSTTFRPGQVATVSGKATPGASVMVWAAEDWWLMPTVTLTADANGTWTARTRSALPDAPVQIITRQTHGTKIENTRHTLTPEK